MHEVTSEESESLTDWKLLNSVFCIFAGKEMDGKSNAL